METNQSIKNQSNEEWRHASIVLPPLSLEDHYEPIQWSEDEVVGLKVVGVFEKVIGNKTLYSTWIMDPNPSENATIKLTINKEKYAFYLNDKNSVPSLYF